MESLIELLTVARALGAVWGELPGGTLERAIAMLVLWSEASPRIRTFHLEFPWKIPNARAITLWPLVLYSHGHMTACVRAHEMVHVRQLKKRGALAFYVTYLLRAVKNGGGRRHPDEIPAYAAEDACNEEVSRGS